MRNLIPIALFLFSCLPCHGQFLSFHAMNPTPLWATGTGNVIQDANNFTCPSLATSCVVTTTATTALSVLTCELEGRNSNGTASSVSIASCSGGGGSWVMCPSSSCQLSNTYDTGQGSQQPMDLGYNLTGTGGATSITVNISAALPSGNWAVAVVEYARPKNTGGRVVFDAVGTGNNNSNTTCTTCTTASFGPLAGNDLITGCWGMQNSSTIATPYYKSASTGADAYSYPNAPNGAVTGTVTQSAGGGATLNGIAFKVVMR